MANRERPILFNREMVRAVLDGRKTQTRRIMNPQPEFEQGYEAPHEHEIGIFWKDEESLDSIEHLISLCPYGKPGDELWVRETWQTWCEFDHLSPGKLPEDADIQYPATCDHWVSKERPSIHMPRWASRIQLKITNVRVERLLDISEQDALAEGIARSTRRVLGGHETIYKDYVDVGHYFHSPKKSFESLWVSINGPDSWDSNPYLWVIQFEKIEKSLSEAA